MKASLSICYLARTGKVKKVDKWVPHERHAEGKARKDGHFVIERKRNLFLNQEVDLI